MEFRHSGNGGARRRRVLFDDANHADDSTETKRGAAGDARRRASHYADAARADCETRVSDFIPTRVSTLLMLFLTGLVLMAALINAHQQHEDWAKYLASDCLEILDLSAPVNLASWFSSAGLALAALTAILIYRIRRHQVDDYRARYRVWVWASLFLLAASMNATVGFHELVKGVAVRFTGTNLWGDGTIWWLIVGTVLATPLMVVLSIDMRRSKSANFMFLASLGCYAAAAMLALEIVMKADFPIYLEVTAGATLLGHLLLMTTLWIFSRHVLLGVQEKLPSVKNEKSRRKASKKAPNKSATAARKSRNVAANEIEKVVPSPRLRRTDLDQSDGEESNQVGGGDSGLDDGQGLSKAERRRMRKQLRRQKKAA